MREGDGLGLRGIVRLRAWEDGVLVQDSVTTNLVLDTLLERYADGGQLTLPELAIGDDATDPSPNNSQLNNEIYRTPVGQDESTGGDRLTSTLISQNEMNGESIVEIGFHDGDQALTHTVLPASDRIDEKTAAMTVTIDYILQHQRVE